jgi:hypothetical protein
MVAGKMENLCRRESLVRGISEASRLGGDTLFSSRNCLGATNAVAHCAILSQMMDTAITTRCPYCIVGIDLRTMTALRDGLFVCHGCGHTACPGITKYHCHCILCRVFANDVTLSEKCRISTRTRKSNLIELSPEEWEARKRRRTFSVIPA